MKPVILVQKVVQVLLGNVEIREQQELAAPRVHPVLRVPLVLKDPPDLLVFVDHADLPVPRVSKVLEAKMVLRVQMVPMVKLVLVVLKGPLDAVEKMVHKEDVVLLAPKELQVLKVQQVFRDLLVTMVLLAIKVPSANAAHLDPLENVVHKDLKVCVEKLVKLVK
ncbi:hypothetical protein FTX61_22115 [Nitriliruptoraceae bacterium ZYF776]|nr:hypothetical protein [Profundirhabdus halotolerans]